MGFNDKVCKTKKSVVKHVLVFIVKYFFASVKLFQKNVTPLIYIFLFIY